MLTRTQLSIIVALTMGIALLWLWLRGEQPTIASVATTLGTVVTIVYGTVLAFAHYAWPWPVFRGWLVRRPDLRGSWRATLHSDWVDPKNGQKVPPIEAYVVVRQTLTTLSLRLFTDKSRSLSVAHAIEPEPDGLFSFSAVYRNMPKIEYQGSESAIHHGALLMEVHELRPRNLEGHYWTDRGTRGTITLQFRNRLHYSSFEEAKRAIGSW
jgi:hypothetical protein